MNLHIDASGKHEVHGTEGGFWVHVVKDGAGLLVDLKGIAGPFADEVVVRIDWRDKVADPSAPHGTLWRRTREGEVRHEPFNDFALLRPYVAAYEARKAQIAETQK